MYDVNRKNRQGDDVIEFGHDVRRNIDDDVIENQQEMFNVQERIEKVLVEEILQLKRIICAQRSIIEQYDLQMSKSNEHSHPLHVNSIPKMVQKKEEKAATFHRSSRCSYEMPTVSRILQSSHIRHSNKNNNRASIKIGRDAHKYADRRPKDIGTT